MSDAPLSTLSRITLVIPFFNESACLAGMLDELQVQMERVHSTSGIDYDVILVDDGSTDDTWKIIEHQCLQRMQLSGIRLRVNAGQQAALLCGYVHAQGEWVLTLDADLQDPPEVLADMLRLTHDGAEIVIGRRRSREIDTPLKRVTAFGFYRLMQVLGVSAETMQAGDFRLMSRAAVAELVNASHVPLFHRFTIFDLGFQIASVEYDRGRRFAGDTKYSYRRMISLAFQAAWSSRQTRRRLAAICVAVQVASVCLVAMLALFTGNLRLAMAVGSLQLALLAVFLVPAICFMWERSENTPCFQVSQRCGN